MLSPSVNYCAPEGAEWRVEELAAAKDRALARFYMTLDDCDRATFRREHIDIYGDYRECEVWDGRIL